MDGFGEDINDFHLRIGFQKAKDGLEHAVRMARLVGNTGKAETRAMPVLLELHLGGGNVELVLDPRQCTLDDAPLVLQALRPVQTNIDGQYPRSPCMPPSGSRLKKKRVADSRPGN